MEAHLEAQFAELRALSEEVARGMHSQFEPRVVAYCFAKRDHMPEARPRLTMQGWIDLEAAQSPFLLDGKRVNPFCDVEVALGILGWKKELKEVQRPNWWGRRITAGRMAELTVQITLTMRQAFSTAIRMEPPRKRADGLEEDGFGDWCPLMACLISEMHFSRAEALRCEVSAAFALVASMRRNQGWHAVGDNYRAREIGGAAS